MNILLLQPRPNGASWLGNLTCFEPLGLEAIAAPLQEEHNIKLVDFFKFNDLRSTLSLFKPDVCAISCSFARDVNNTLKVVDFVKKSKNNPFVVVGGHHASLSPGDFQKEFIDAVIIGEGEVTFAELVSCLERKGDLMTIAGLILNQDGQQFFSRPRSLIENLDNLPLPARNLSKRFRKQYFCQFEQPVTIVETTRGCPYQCNFCSVHKFYGDRVRFKSPERVVQEVASINEQAIFFSDDNFLADIRRAERIAILIRENKIKKRYNIQARSDTIARYPELIRLWKEVGLTAVLIGFEKIDDEGLKCLNKRNTVESNEKALRILYSLELGLAPSFIVDPDESYEGFAKLLQYVTQLQIKTPVFTVLTPFPGTELFDRVKEKIVVKNYELFDCYHAVLPTRLPLANFYREFSKLYADTLQRYAHSRIDIAGALKRIGRGKLSPFHMRKLTKAVGMLADPNCYLADHYNVKGNA